MHAMGHLEGVWGPDVDEFKPERFLARPRPSPFKAIAFNAGPRTCLGQNMALIEASFVLALLFRSHAVAVVPGQRVRHVESLTLHLAEGLRVTLGPAPPVDPAAAAAVAAAVALGSGAA